MDDKHASTFLLEAAGRGMTVLVLGAADPALLTALAVATGPTGLVCALSTPRDLWPPAPGTGAVWLRASPLAVPIRSHVVDLLAIMPSPEDEEPGALVEEARRLLAPGGVLRALTTVAAAYRLVGELHAAAFRDAESIALGRFLGVRARGPR